MQTVILRFDSLPSTNTEAAAHARRGAREGVCITAREQTAGRGRLQRAWSSPKDAGLYLSIVTRPPFELSKFPLLTFAAALAVRDALIEVYRLKIDIKYPNDVLINEKKVCGILAETVETATGTAAIIGIGINLARTAIAPDLPFATTIEHETGCAPDGEELLHAVINNFNNRYLTLALQDGDTLTLAAWASHSTFAENKTVRVTTHDESFIGTTRGLSSDGALRVEVDGKIKTVRVGDVTAVRATALQT